MTIATGKRMFVYRDMGASFTSGQCRCNWRYDAGCILRAPSPAYIDPAQWSARSTSDCCNAIATIDRTVPLNDIDHSLELRTRFLRGFTFVDIDQPEMPIVVKYAPSLRREKRAPLRANEFVGVNGCKTMSDAHQLALAMFVLACAAVTLISGQLYIEYSATHASAAARSKVATFKAPRSVATIDGARIALVTRGRP